MENNKKNQLVPPTSSHTIEKVSSTTTENHNADIIMALNTLDNIYKNNINSYAESIHACTHEIEDTKSRLASLSNEIAPHKAKLQEAQKEIDYELRTLERFTQEWNEISTVIHILGEELTQLNHSEEEREKILKTRKKSLETLYITIEDTELKLLEQELQKQNIYLEIEPTLSEIKALELRITQLENKKRYIESSQLHKISPLGQATDTQLLESGSNPSTLCQE